MQIYSETVRDKNFVKDVVTSQIAVGLTVVVLTGLEVRI